MNYSFSKLVILGAVLVTTNVEAQIFPKLELGLPKNYGQCISQGGSHLVCQDLFAGLEDCNRNHSQAEDVWRDCIIAVEARFNRGLAKGMPLEQEPYVGESIAVSTNQEDFHYEQKSPEHKGFLNAQH